MRKVETSIKIAAAQDQIISAFIDPEMLKDWWQVERALIDPKPGGVYTLAWDISDEGFGFVSAGTILDYKKDLLMVDNLVYLNPERPILGPMSLTVKATRKDVGSEMYLQQAGYQSGPHWDWYYQTVKEVWPKMAVVLKNYLEKGVSLR